MKFRMAFGAFTALAAGLTGAMVEPAHAQAPLTARSQTFDFDVPAQLLGKAISRLASQANLQVLYNDSEPTKIEAPAVKGRMTVEEALSRLLAGSGYTYQYVRPGIITLRPVDREGNEGARMLGPVRVEGADQRVLNGGNGSRDITATEGTGSFTSGALTIGSKAPRAIKDTTQSVSVITAERLEQQNINDFTRALQQAPGISFAQGNTNLETVFYSRGFEITSIQIDGGAPLTTRFAGATAYFPQIDLSQYDHVEILRGAAGLFNGYGDPSGTINLVRKKPLDHPQVTLDAEGGSWDHYRLVADASGPLAFDGALRGRLVVTWQSNKQFYEIAEDQRTLVYGVVDYDLTDTTLLTVGFSQTDQDSTPWYGGLPRYQTGGDLQLSRDTCLCFPWNRQSFDTTEVFTQVEQKIGNNWRAKLNLTHNDQSSTRKYGYAFFAVNPIDNRGPRLVGDYTDYASDQTSVEATLAGTFELFGQRQELTFGINRSDQDGGGLTQYASPGLIASSSTAPYQPYPGGPLFCTSATVCPDTRIASPPINVFAFNAYDPLYTEPRNPIANVRYPEQGQIQSLAYIDLRLTAFERLHLETGVRWSRYERKYLKESLCTAIPASGVPSESNCVGRKVGDPYAPLRRAYSGENVSWPPAVSLSYDVTDQLVTYLGYTDIYEDQSNNLDLDLDPLDPITGDNLEFGVKWSGRGGRLNGAVALYRINKKGFAVQDASVPVYQPDPFHQCCYTIQQGSKLVSEGFDTELSGEVLPGLQIAASYTFSRNHSEASVYGSKDGPSFLTIQPKSLYKLWASYDFGVAGAGGWLSGLMFSTGINGQSEGYRADSVCPDGQVGPPNAFTGISSCLVSTVPFEFAVEPYTVVSSRVDYKLSDDWSVALNIENLFDKTYYQSVGSVTGGNWYGAPRTFTLSLRARW